MSRRLAISVLALFTLALALHVAPATAHEAPATAGSAGVKAEMLSWIKDAEDKLLQLAEATPEDKYSWRPAKDVRSTGEVFMHAAAANFGLPGFWGVAPPAGFSFPTYETSLTKKADIQKALKDSFAHMEQALATASDADLEKQTEFFGMKSSVRGGYMLLLSHVHEHLGQSIAYARMNGVVPPWTAKQQAEAAAKAKGDAKPAAK